MLFIPLVTSPHATNVKPAGIAVAKHLSSHIFSPNPALLNSQLLAPIHNDTKSLTTTAFASSAGLLHLKMVAHTKVFSDLSKDLLADIHTYRGKKGLRALKFSKELSVIAQGHAHSLIKARNEQRSTPNLSFKDSELIAIFKRDDVPLGKDFLNAWRLNPRPRQQIISDDFTFIGVGIVGAKNMYCAVAVLGTAASPADQQALEKSSDGSNHDHDETRPVTVYKNAPRRTLSRQRKLTRAQSYASVSESSDGGMLPVYGGSRCRAGSVSSSSESSIGHQKSFNSSGSVSTSSGDSGADPSIKMNSDSEGGRGRHMASTSGSNKSSMDLKSGFVCEESCGTDEESEFPHLRWKGMNVKAFPETNRERKVRSERLQSIATKAFRDLNRTRKQHNVDLLKWDDILGAMTVAHCRSMYLAGAFRRSKQESYAEVMVVVDIDGCDTSEAGKKVCEALARKGVNMLRPVYKYCGIAVYGDSKRVFATAFLSRQ